MLHPETMQTMLNILMERVVRIERAIVGITTQIDLPEPNISRFTGELPSILSDMADAIKYHDELKKNEGA